MANQSGRTIWTYEPDDDVKSLMKKAITSKVGRAAMKNDKHAARGMRSKILNSALREHLARFLGKREASV